MKGTISSVTSYIETSSFLNKAAWWAIYSTPVSFGIFVVGELPLWGLAAEESWFLPWACVSTHWGRR